MQKRTILSVLVGGLIAAMLPPAAAAQTEADGAVTYAENMTCDFGQGSAMELPACEASEDGSVLSLTFINPQSRSGPFEGISVLDGVLVGNFADATFEVGGTVFFAGAVEGCGEGTVYFDYAGSGTQDESGALIGVPNLLPSIPGGTLPVKATIDEIGVTEAVLNGDGTAPIMSAVSYSCDAAV